MSFISPFHIRFKFSFIKPKFLGKMPKILQILRNSGSKIRADFCQISWGSNHFIKVIPCHTAHYRMDNQAPYSEVPWIIMLYQHSNWRLKIKRPRAWNMSDRSCGDHNTKWNENRVTAATKAAQFYKKRKKIWFSVPWHVRRVTNSAIHILPSLLNSNLIYLRLCTYLELALIL